jgi:A/G-specific adenine glycosylase
MQKFTDELINWYEKNKRDLPFRHTNDPYAIWVSEIMLQQTTVTAVIPYYYRFLSTYPTVKDLANASLDDVYKLWEGLGYYRRAKNLHLAAIKIVDEFKGIFPRDHTDILSLPGIGPYTASAISSFAYHEEYAAIDGNALRVLSRMLGLHDNIAQAKTIKRITDYANKMIVGKDSASFNQGLMDLSNAYCRPKNPDCSNCPLVTYCQAYKHHEEKVLPIHIKKIKKTEHSFITGYITYQDQVMMKVNDEGLLEHMYGLVQYEVSDPYMFMETFEKEFGQPLYLESFVKDFKHVFTHRTWYMHVFHFVLSTPNSYLMTNADLKKAAIPTAHKKILDFINKHRITS